MLLILKRVLDLLGKKKLLASLISFALLVVIAVPFLGHALAASNLQVHFINVGQGDSILVQLPDGQNMLVDAGPNSQGTNVVNYIKGKGISRLDHVVGTHPHEDHIGGLDNAIKSFTIGKVYMPNKTSTTQTYKDVINAVNSKGLTITRAKKGVTLINKTVDGKTLQVVMVAPIKDSYSNTNDYSAVIRIVYGSTKFMLTGDAETTSETDMVNSGQTLSANILKVGHHGSSTSTSSAFLNKVNPSVAVISVGADNSYGHPDTETIDRLKSKGIKIYRTDVNGTVIFTTTGSGWVVNKQPWWQP